MCGTHRLAVAEEPEAGAHLEVCSSCGSLKCVCEWLFASLSQSFRLLCPQVSNFIYCFVRVWILKLLFALLAPIAVLAPSFGFPAHKFTAADPQVIWSLLLIMIMKHAGLADAWGERSRIRRTPPGSSTSCLSTSQSFSFGAAT